MSRRTRTAAWALAAALAAGTPAGRAATLAVTNTQDGGAGSLRQAILDANASPEGDLIQFAIPGPGPHTILTFSPLTITGSLLLDGYSQPGSLWNTDPIADNAVLQVELFGQGSDGLAITGGAAIVQGLALYGFQTAIAVSGPPGVTIQGNFIGADAAGHPAGNVTGVSITGAAGLDKIGDNYPAARNLISGNTSAGVVLDGGSQARVLGNLIGTDPTGAAPAPNGTGIRLVNTSGHQVGGIAAEDRNVISGNFESGVVISSGAGDRVEGNLIGTDASGTAALGNGGHGVLVDGTSPAFDIRSNVISGNAGNGVSLAFLAPAAEFLTAKVTSNTIGLNAAGDGAIGNGGAGVHIESGDGIEVWGNALAHNRAGVRRVSPSVNQSAVFRNNSIHSNGGLGIVFGSPGSVPFNLPEGRFNFPLIASAVTAGGDTTITGTYAGRPATEVTLDFYRNPPCDAVRPQEFDEGKAYFWTLTLVTDGQGRTPFSFTIPAYDLAGQTVTATATTRLTSFLGEGFVFPTYQTSPFSQRLPFAIAPRSGQGSGGSPVSISGTDFSPGAAVTIGGQPASSVTVEAPPLITAQAPALPAGAAYDVVVTNTDGTHGTLPLGWVADFLDVPPVHPFHDHVVALVSNGISGGTGAGAFGPDQATLRQQMAVFLLKGRHGICFAPPPCAGTFSDVPCSSPFAPWIEALASEGITAGCGPGLYCPQSPVRRDQMAVFLLKAEHGAAYAPPPCTGVFADVPCPSPFADWIEQLAEENVTGGCGGGNYCPASPNTRGQMAVFLVKTFGLP